MRVVGVLRPTRPSVKPSAGAPAQRRHPSGAAPIFPGRSKPRTSRPSPNTVASTMTLSALEESGIRWTGVFAGGGVAAVVATASAGLAVVAALIQGVAPRESVNIGPQLGLLQAPAATVMPSEANKKSLSEDSVAVIGLGV